MGRAPCCDKANVKKGPWSPDEDAKLKAFIDQHGTGGNWISLPSKAGLKRCGKSCRLRWINYLRPDIKHGGFTEEEEIMIYKMHANIGSRWSLIAAQLPGRTDNDIKNYWNTRLKKKYNDRNVEQLSLPNLPRLSPPRDKFSHGSPPRDRFANERDDDPVMTTISSCELTPSSELTVLRDPSDGLVPRFGKSQQYASPHLRDATKLPDVVVATPSVQSQPMTSIQQQQIHQQIQQQQVQQQLQQQQQVQQQLQQQQQQQQLQQQQQVQQQIQQQQQVQQIQQQQQVQHQQQIRIVKSEFSDLQATGGVGEVREKLLIDNRLSYCIPSHPSSTSSSSCSGMSIDRSSYTQSCNGMNAENSTYVSAAQGVENTYSDCLSAVVYRDDQLNEVEESSALLPVMSSAVSPSSFGISSSVQSDMAHGCEDSTALVTGMSTSAVAPSFGIRNSIVAPSEFGIQISTEPELPFSGMGVQEFFEDGSKIITGGVKTEANWYDYMSPPKHTVSFTSVAAAHKQYQHHQHQYHQMQQQFVHPDSWVSPEPSPSSYIKATWINVGSSCNGNLPLSGPTADHMGFRYEQKPISWNS